MRKDIHVYIERDADGWLVGSVPGLPGCYTQARTIDELAVRMQEAIEAYLAETDDALPMADFVAVQKISVDL